MLKKIILIFVLYALLIIIAGDSLWTVLFFLSGPAIAYVFVKVLIIEAPGNFISRLFYGENSCKKPVKELSHIHILILNNKYTEAYNTLLQIDGQFLEVEKLKMKILTDHLNRPMEALHIGMAILNEQKPSHDHIPLLGNCVEIYIEAGDFQSAENLLKKYGPKMPTQYLVQEKYQRITALQS